MSHGECVTCEEPLRNGEGLCEGCYDKSLKERTASIQSRLTAATEDARKSGLEACGSKLDNTALRRQLGISEARVAELDGQLSAVLAEAHLNGTYTPTCAKAEMVLLGTTKRSADSVPVVKGVGRVDDGVAQSDNAPEEGGAARSGMMSSGSAGQPTLGVEQRDPSPQDPGSSPGTIVDSASDARSSKPTRDEAIAWAKSGPPEPEDGILAGPAPRASDALSAEDIAELERPIEEVDAELRAMGVDPEELGNRGAAFVQRLKTERKLAPAPDSNAPIGVTEHGDKVYPIRPVWCTHTPIHWTLAECQLYRRNGDVGEQRSNDAPVERELTDDELAALHEPSCGPDCPDCAKYRRTHPNEPTSADDCGKGHHLSPNLKCTLGKGHNGVCMYSIDAVLAACVPAAAPRVDKASSTLPQRMHGRLERMAAEARYRAQRLAEEETPDAEATDDAIEATEFEAAIIERCANALVEVMRKEPEQRTDYPRVDPQIRPLRDLLRLLVGHLEVDAKAGDGIHEDAYDDYHAARMLVGQAGEGWDADAAGRAMRRITGDESWTAEKGIQ